MKGIITIQDEFNPNKKVQFKQSNCYHFYQRQLICGKPVTNWQRAPKKFIQDTMKRFTQGTLLN